MTQLPPRLVLPDGTPVRAEPRPPRPAPERLRAAFRDADRDGDGALDRGEATAALRRGGVLLPGFAADRFDGDRDGRISFAEARGLAAHGSAPAVLDRLERAPAASLAGRVDRALPRDRFDHEWQRERVIERAGAFERDVRTMAADQRPTGALGALRGQLGERFDPNAQIELHGVATHSGPESLQAHVRDRTGARHVFLRDTRGQWVEREDLARLADQGRPPVSERGQTRDPASGTATFGVARVGQGGRVDFEVPDLTRFDHSPRNHPFRVGDVVQVSRATGAEDSRREGAPFVAQDNVEFGRITGSDGRGGWTVQLTDRDGAARNGPDGRPIDVRLSDADLRRTNNPHMLRGGDRVHDTAFDPNHPAQRRMVDEWHRSEPYQRLEASRPGPNAPAGERAAWEERAIRESERWLGERVHYPAPSDAEREQWRGRIRAIDGEIGGLREQIARRDAAPAAAGQALGGRREPPANPLAPRPEERIRELERERERVSGRLERAEGDTRRLGELDAQIAGLERDRTRAAGAGEQTAAIDGQLAAARADREPIARRIEQDRRYHAELVDKEPPRNVGEFFENGTVQCRHHAVSMQVLLQDIGVDSRMTRGAANTRTGDYRGEHLWLEASLSDGRQMLVDPTWRDVLPLRRTYEDDVRRREVPRETERDYHSQVVIDPRARWFTPIVA